MKNKSKITRRKFMAAAGGSLVSIGLPGVFVKLLDAENEALAAELRPDGRTRIPPGQHAVKTLSDMGGVPGVGPVPEWRMEIVGAVKKPLTLTFEDVMKLPQVSQTCDVHCVTGWTLLDSRWQGVSLQAVMDLVKVKREAKFVIFEAPADYSSNIPVSDVKKGNGILAHGFSGQPLPKAHGAPLRSLVPDRYFYKSVKWVQRIKFTVEDEPGYYETRGYSNSADPWKEERFDD
ncbi:MAG: molybdopterin-dependent oxidoreductase [Thermodesulfobacteriota bacterium]